MKYVLLFYIFKKCDWRALDALFTYHGSDVLPHRLAVLSNFPETYSPFEYRSLLPEAKYFFFWYFMVFDIWSQQI